MLFFCVDLLCWAWLVQHTNSKWSSDLPKHHLGHLYSILITFGIISMHKKYKSLILVRILSFLLSMMKNPKKCLKIIGLLSFVLCFANLSWQWCGTNEKVYVSKLCLFDLCFIYSHKSYQRSLGRWFLRFGRGGVWHVIKVSGCNQTGDITITWYMS